MAFGFYSPLSINSGQVPSTQTDFPVLVNVTDARLKTVANSGHVQNSSGFDIRPYTDSTLTTAITGYELERYNASTGEVIMWVKVASLSSSTTPFVLAYGDSGITTNGSSATAWSSSYVSVYHFKDGATLSLADSANGKALVNNNAATATTGQIDGGVGLASASSQHLSHGSGENPGAAFTVSAWIKGTTFANSYNPVIAFAPSTEMGIFVRSTGKMAFYLGATGGAVSLDPGSHTQSTGTWYYVAMTYSSSTGLVGYVNAASDGTAAANGTATTHDQLDIGTDPVGPGSFWNGSVDEVHTASVARAANWITTEYNNQVAPGTFATLGTEVAVGGARQSNWMLFFS